jgi:hypothetical protein
VRLPCKLS